MRANAVNCMVYPLAPVQDYVSDFEGGEADGAALREAERWEPDPGE